jgi:hypothetical protein
MSNRTSNVGRVATLGLALLFGVLGVVSVGAQSTESTPAMAGQLPPHPAHIHSGTCDTLGDIVAPLNDVTSGSAMATPGATPSIAMAATPEAGAAEQSSTTVDIALDEMVNGEHAINVHESAENIQNYIACGDVSGEVTDGMLEVRLEELNGSGFAGVAMLTDNGDGTTTVEITLTAAGTIEATPAG